MRRGLTIKMQDQRSGFRNFGSEEKRHRSLVTKPKKHGTDIEFDL